MEIFFTTVFHCSVFISLVCIINFLFECIYWNCFLQFFKDDEDPSTRIGIFLKPQLFLSGFSFRPPIYSEFTCESAIFLIRSPEWKFLNPQTFWNRVDRRIRIFFNPMTWQSRVWFFKSPWRFRLVKDTAH